MRVMNRKLVRDLLRAKGQAAAVITVVLFGVATFITMATAHRNLLLTRDTYYSEYRFADFNLMLERAPMTAVHRIEALPGVRRARGRIVKDVNLDLAGIDEPRIGRVISMPDRREAVLNDICLLSGRYFETGAANEVILSDAFAEANGLGVGDTFQATLDNRKHTLRVAGTALSPEYVYMIRSAQEIIPSPERFGILWIPQSFAEMAFNMRSACNDIVGTLDGSVDPDALLDRMESMLDSYGVFAKVKREDQMSNRFLSDEIQQLEVSATLIPGIFLGIAALILLVLLGRMVRQERTQIGLMKAFGYSNAAVASHYLKFALVLAGLGCIGGAFLGQWLAGLMIRVYTEFYQFPLLRSRVYPDVLARAAAITALAGVLGALSAARGAARIRPADAMRAQAPRYSRRTLLERIEPLWRRLSFSSKMIARNVSRYRLRAALTVFGVMISSGLMVVGFFSMDSMNYMIAFQFTEAQREDIKVAFEGERGRGAYLELRRLDHVRGVEPLLEYPFEIRAGWRVKQTVIVGLPEDAEMMRLLDTAGRRVRPGESGLVLPEHLARQLGVAAGDTVTLKPLMGRVTRERDVPVRQVVQQYLGSSGYMAIEALSRLLDEPFAMNAALLRADPGREHDINRHFRDIPGVASVAIKRDAYESLMDTLAASMNISNTVLALFSGVIAFAIIYNSTLVSLAERQRELASLRVLGFSIREVGAIVYNENFLLSAAGLAMGIPFGMAQCRLLVYAFDTDLYRLPFHVEPATFVRTAAFTVVFVILANLAVRRKIRTLDMVEVLKARE